MLAQGCMDALQMALSNRLYPGGQLIHHSDRGSQYCCRDYIDILNKHNIAISMTESGDPYENALAERMNGIIKTEFNLHSTYLNFDQTYELILKSVEAYNKLRPHMSCDFLTPAAAHITDQPLIKRWKNSRKRYLKQNDQTVHNQYQEINPPS